MVSESPPRKRRKEARPSELTAAALGLFVEKGFAATRLEEVALRAGVSKGTLYLYFDSKEALFKAVIQEGIIPVVAEGEVVGSVGVLGPTRMNYPQALATVEVVGEQVVTITRDLGPAVLGWDRVLTAAEREAIFARGARLDDTGKPGTGLGLAIVRDIAIDHGATVSVTAGADGRGTIFSVEFPPV